MSDSPPNKQALIHPLVGASPGHFLWRYRQHGPYDRRSRLARFLTAVVLAGRMPLEWLDRLHHGGRYRNAAAPRDPVFIIGHWRSGTTHFHNILSQDPQFGWLSLIPGLFPNDMEGLLSTIAREYLQRVLPRKRSFDNVRVGLDVPQEEEICLANLGSLSYFNGYYYPQRFFEHFRRAVLLGGLTDGELREFEGAYSTLAARLSVLRGGRRLLFKNPNATGRIRMLKRVFPCAKFIHLVRNPYTVFASSLRRLPAMFNAFAWQDYRHLDLETIVFDCYRLMMRRYLDDSRALSADDLIEVRFEDLAARPNDEIARVYQWLGLEPDGDALGRYLDSQAGYERNLHRLTEPQLQRIATEWAFALQHWGYSRPAEIGVAEDRAAAA